MEYSTPGLASPVLSREESLPSFNLLAVLYRGSITVTITKN